MSKPGRRINRRVFSASLLAPGVMAWLPAVAQPQGALVGQQAPEFSATDAAGQSHKLSNFKGRIVVLEWTNPACPFVKKHYNGNMQALQKEFTGKGVMWLTVNSTERASADFLTPAKITQWNAEKQAHPTAALLDESGVLGKLYAAKTTPHMFIVNAEGRLIYAGAIDSVPSARIEDIPSATNFIRQGLTEALGGKPLTVASSPAYGCSVKYKA